MIRKSSLFFKVLLIAGLSAACNDGAAQGLIEADIGAGFPDLVSVKAKFGRYLQVGITQGFEGVLNLTGMEVYYHPIQKKDPEGRRNFYIMCGFSSTIFGKGYAKYEKSFIYPRIGRSFYFSRNSTRFGLNGDIGITIIRALNPPEGYLTSVIPLAASVSLFVKI